MKHEIKIGSLFSGIGGIELGFEHAGGFKTEWFVECELFPQHILRKHFPSAHIYDDVEKVDFGAVPKVEVLTGGFPCQDISNAGKRAGIEGSRSSLWKHYLRAIVQIRPKVAFIENVSALTSRGLSEVLCDLASVGYDAEWHCVPASAIGANHKRDRIFILAYASGFRFQNWNNSSSGKFGISREQWRTHAACTCSSFKNVGNADNRCLKESEIQTRGNSFEHASSDVPDALCRRSNGEQCEKSSSQTWQPSFWATEPDVGRVAHGVPLRVDRIEGLGNAVVPQVAEVFAKAIKEVLR